MFKQNIYYAYQIVWNYDFHWFHSDFVSFFPLDQSSFSFRFESVGRTHGSTGCFVRLIFKSINSKPDDVLNQHFRSSILRFKEKFSTPEIKVVGDKTRKSLCAQSSIYFCADCLSIDLRKEFELIEEHF